MKGRIGWLRTGGNGAKMRACFIKYCEGASALNEKGFSISKYLFELVKGKNILPV
jgi:hypothetical protein